MGKENNNLKQTEDLIIDLRNNLKELDEQVGELEYTKNNYDNEGTLIEGGIPTITTSDCEIGAYGNVVYFVYIIKARDYKKDIFDGLIDKTNLSIYGLKNFNKILYPQSKFDYECFEKEISKDKYLQFQFDYENIDVSYLVEEYKMIKSAFKKSGIKPINQLTNDLSKI